MKGFPYSIGRGVALALVILFAAVAPAGAWDCHAVLTRATFVKEPLAKETVKVEPLEAFLAAEPQAVKKALDAAESRAVALLPQHRLRPAALAFDPAAGPSLRASFLRALRVNPEVPLALFLEPAPGAPRSGRPILAERKVSLVAATLAGGPFEALAPGDKVSALEVLVAASDEPDYGLDVGLYENNGTTWGKEYGFGVQPWGNPALSYGSQAPFHMSFSREDKIIGLAAPFTKRSNAAYRDLQYETLSRLAFATDHPYWGLRFAGWALHYVQDMGQPWHARMIPGRSTLSILLINIFGSAKAKAGEVVLLSNRHLLFEAFTLGAMISTDGSGSRALLEAALAGKDAPAPAPWRELRLIDGSAARAYAAGPSIDRLVVGSFPKRYADDPSYDYGLARDEGRESYEAYRDLSAADPAAAAKLVKAIAPLLAGVGADARDLLGALRSGQSALPPAGAGK
jgi:hypothetical protein